MALPTVLLSAYAVDPERGSEPGVGFRWIALWLGLGWRVVALVHRDRRGGVERTAARLADAVAEGRLELIAIEPPRWQRVLQATPGCWWTYYRCWQGSARRAAERWLAERGPATAAHHVSMNGYREPGGLWRLPPPFLWGPIGGLQDADERFLAPQPWRVRLGERARTAINRWCARHGRRARAARRRAALVLAANRESAAWAADGAARTRRLLETAVDAVPSAVPDADGRAGILWVGSDEPRKNPEFALLAFAVLRRARPDERLTLVGLSPARRDALAAWAAARGVALDGVELVERLPRADLARRFRAARLAWFTSYRDTSGNVVLEAMAGGAPVVAFDHQGAATMLAGGAGALIAVDGYRAMLAAWTRRSLRLLADPGAWRQTQRAALARLRERFAWDRTAAAFAAELAAIGLPVPAPVAAMEAA